MEWKVVEGRLKMISINLGGVWGLSETGDIFYRMGTFENYQSPGIGWWQVEGKLEQLSVGWNTVWAIDRLGQVWYRDGLDIEHVTGTKWIPVPTPGSFKQVSVDRGGHLWGLDTMNNVYFRQGAALQQIPGQFWQKVGTRRLAQLDVGQAGVWGVDENKEIFHRQGTYEENGMQGESWTPVGSGDKLLSQVSAGGRDMVVGLTSRGELYVRKNMSPAHPVGCSWERVKGCLTQVDVYGYTAWGIDCLGTPVYGQLLPASKAPCRMLRETFN